MPRIAGTTYAVLSLGAVVAGCQSTPVRYADKGVHATYQVAATGAGVVRTAGSELYEGAGSAVRRPFHDLNLMQDKIAPVLLRAEDRPYDLTGVNSCVDVLNRVAELDLALGPDVDTPKERKNRRGRGADFAARAALDAAGSAAEHFIPMRSTIKELSGATRYENHVKHAVLAGTVRRSFLKAVGMAHSCTWPAAPLDFRPLQVADLNSPWVPQMAVAAPPPAAGAVLAVSTTPAATAPLLRGLTPAAPAEAAAASPAPASPRPASPRVVLVSAATAGRPGGPVVVPVPDQLTMPSAAPPAAASSQAWRPSKMKAITVADKVTTTASLDANAGTGLSTAATAAAPWAATFTGAAVRP